MEKKWEENFKCFPHWHMGMKNSLADWVQARPNVFQKVLSGPFPSFNTDLICVASSSGKVSRVVARCPLAVPYLQPGGFQAPRKQEAAP